MTQTLTYCKPTPLDKEDLMDYVHEHGELGETFISASHGLATMSYFEWLVNANHLAIISSTNLPQTSIYLVKLKTSIVGLLSICYKTDPKSGELYGSISYGVRPTARGMGIATAILTFGISECKRNGLKHAIACCEKENVAAIKTILKCGGRFIEQQPNANGSQHCYQFELKEEPEVKEVWDLYDANRNLLDQDMVRGTIIPDGCYHLGIHAWIKNSEGKYLMSQRVSTRKAYPLKWECVGGSALKGEDSLTAALREIKEEIGIDMPPSSGKIADSMIRDIINGVRFNDIVDIWLFEYDGNACLKDATTPEVAQTKWMSLEEIRYLYENGEMVPTLTYFFDNRIFLK
jgi:predicted acetyltransferase/isopentenyldiphosphate isomerase